MMVDEGSKARLVRCPECDNLLTELPNYSVYQCGGCGAFLRAKKKVAGNGGLLGNLEKESLSEKEDVSYLDIASEAERESNDGVFLDRRKETIFRERTVNWVNGSSSRIQNNDSSIDSRNRIVKEKIVGYAYKNCAEKGIDYDDIYRLPLKHPIGNWVGRDGNEMNMNTSESVTSGKGKGIGEISAQYKGSTGSLRSRTIMGKWGLDGNGLEGPYGNFKMDSDRNQFSNFAYPVEGPSNYYLGPSTYGYGKNFDDPNRPNRFAQLEQDRAELFRKLEELKEQIYRSDTVAEKQREGTFLDVKIPPSGAYHDHVTHNNVLVKPLAPDKHVPRVPFFKQYGHEPVLHANSYDTDMQNFYFPPKHVANEFPVYEDPIQLQIPRVNSHQLPGQYQRQPPYDYLLGKHMDFDQESLAFFPHRAQNHKPACACFHCYKRNQHIPSQFGSQNHNLHASLPVLRSQDPKSHAIWPSDFDSDMDVFHQGGLRKTVVAPHGNRRVCHPIAAGAPFITCCSCFELLKLPRRLKAKEMTLLKLRCGACSKVLLFEIKNKQLIISVLVQNTQVLAGASDGSRDISKEVLSSPDGGLIGEGTNCSIDFDSPGYDFQSTDCERNIQSEDRRLNLSEFGKRHGLSSLSCVSSEEEESLDSMIVQRDVSYIHELHTKDNASPTFLGSPLAENLVDGLYNHEVNRYEDGNKSNRTDQEKAILDKSGSQQNSVKEVSAETEVEVSFNEYLRNSLSQDSTEVSREEDRSRINKGNGSFLVGLLKKSFRDFSRSNHLVEDAKPHVYVNGHLIPDSMVKKAERLAGPVRPGDYWYDFQAGFWGVMGQPCLGIIPPSIKEFNYPMPNNCAAGNTGVFVNGRELHQKDLDLLASRGLPTTKEKSYIIEISGRVLDKDSGKQLKSLGKLAPTVLKLNRGFGMKVPKKLM